MCLQPTITGACTRRHQLILLSTPREAQNPTWYLDSWYISAHAPLPLMGWESWQLLTWPSTNLIMALEPDQCPQGTILWLIQETLFLVSQGQRAHGLPLCSGYNRVHTHLLLPTSSQVSKGDNFHVGNHGPLRCYDKLLGVDIFRRAFRTFQSRR